MKVTIITALYNQLELTKAYWESLQAHPPDEPWEIIWIDDCSTDGTREWLKSINADNSTVLLNESNQGFAANNNAGARHAKGDVLCLLNNDTVLLPGWFPPMKATLIKNGSVGVVGNIQLQARTKRIDHAGMAFNLVGDTIHPAKDNTYEKPSKSKDIEYKSVTAACWLIRKETFLSVGGFDTDYKNGYEDADLCMRLSADGYKHWVSQQSCILHHVKASRGVSEKDTLNRARFLSKWSAITAELGQKEWPAYYLKHLSKYPSQFNLIKAVDALLRLIRIRHGDSRWAARQRAAAIHAALDI